MVSTERIAVKVEKVRCPRCRYEWEPKVKDPKKCPRCQKRLDRVNLKVVPQ